MKSLSDEKGYRYGFNGKEQDPEMDSGNGNIYDYGFRIYNSQIAKFLSVDPLTKSYPMLTPYQFASNTPIAAIDLDGLESLISIAPRKNYTHTTEFLLNGAVDVYLTLRNNGLSIHGAVLKVGLSTGESGWGKQKKNLFGMMSGGKVIDYNGDFNAMFNAWKGMMKAKYQDPMSLLKGSATVSSDAWNYETNSGPYINNGSSYNYDDKASEATKVWFIKYKNGAKVDEYETGMVDYGNFSIEAAMSAVARWNEILPEEIANLRIERCMLVLTNSKNTERINEISSEIKNLERVYNEIQSVWFGDLESKEGSYNYKYKRKGKSKSGVKYSGNVRKIGSGKEGMKKYGKKN